MGRPPMPLLDLIPRGKDRPRRVPCIVCKSKTAQTVDTEIRGIGHICFECRTKVCGACNHARRRSHPLISMERIIGIPDLVFGPCKVKDCGCMMWVAPLTPLHAYNLLVPVAKQEDGVA